MKHREHNIETVTCVVCGSPFATRLPSLAKYCSDPCRRYVKRMADRARYDPRTDRKLRERRAYTPRMPVYEEPPPPRSIIAEQTTTCLACHSLGLRQRACRRCGRWLP